MINLSTGKPMTRRSALTGLAGILAAGVAPAAVVRSMLGARGVATSGGGWKNPYVTYGLVAMWDGEWNAGGGIHDASATVWKDLSGNNRDWIFKRGNFSWNDDSLSLNDTLWEQDQLPKSYTAEVVCQQKNGRWMLVLYGIGNSSPGIIQGFVCIGDVSGWQVSFTYPTPTQTLWPLVNVKTKHSISVVYEDYNEQSVVTKDAFINGDVASLRNGENLWANPGKSTLGDNPSWRSPFVGQIWSIRLYSRVLTDAERLKNYSIDNARFGLT